MSKRIKKRVRLFAGPNGSGKSTFFENFRESYDTGLYLNADQLQHILQNEHRLDLNDLGIKTSQELFSSFKQKKASRSLLQKARRAGSAIALTFEKDIIFSHSDKPTAYEASFLGAFIRNECMRLGISFSYESVMSHPSKLNDLKDASDSGFRTYLYFICTDSPLVNLERVRNRVQKRGHDVPKQKIKSRYYKSLKQALDASLLCNRAYFLDNSGKEIRLIADMIEGEKMTFHEKNPDQYEWFDKYILSPLQTMT